MEPLTGSSQRDFRRRSPEIRLILESGEFWSGLPRPIGRSQRGAVNHSGLGPSCGRCAHSMTLPDKATRLVIFQIHTRGKPLAKGLDLSAIADATEGYSGADLAGTCSKAALLAIREYLETHEGDTNGYGGFTITMKNMEEARKIIERQRA